MSLKEPQFLFLNLYTTRPIVSTSHNQILFLYSTLSTFITHNILCCTECPWYSLRILWFVLKGFHTCTRRLRTILRGHDFGFNFSIPWL